MEIEIHKGELTWIPKTVIYNGKEYFLAYVKGEIKMADGGKMAQGGITDYDDDIRQVVLKFLASEDDFKFNLECKEKSYRSTKSKVIEYNGEDYFVEFIFYCKVYVN